MRKRKSAAGLWSIVVIVAFLGSGSLHAAGSSSQKSASQKEVAEVEAAMRAYEHLVRLKDSSGISAFYTRDGELLEAGMEPLKGPEAIRKFLESIPPVEIESSTMTPEATEVCNDLAIQWGSYAQRITAPGKPAAEYKGRFVAEWSRQGNGAWLIRRLLVQPSPER